jgi:hypothetical protein
VTCPLCRAATPDSPRIAFGRRFGDCPQCRLVAVDREQLLAPDDERARYDTHDNQVDDPGYRDFLRPALEAVRAACPPGAEGLDYGAGPGPALAAMLAEAGHRTALWDPFYHPDPSPLKRTWAFVVCTETAEHFHHPAVEFERLASLLEGPGAVLVVMTQPLKANQRFEEWWYVRDPTHVAFYRDETFDWLARRHDWTLARPHPSVAVFTRRRAAASGTSDRTRQPAPPPASTPSPNSRPASP